MNPQQQAAHQAGFVVGMVLGALFVGILCGLVPLIVGLRKGKTGLAIGGFAACVAGGLVLGLIGAVPMALLFGWLTWRAPAARGPAPTAYEPAKPPPEPYEL